MLPWKVGHRGLDYVQPKPASARDIDHALCLLSWLFSSHSFIASLHVRYWNYLRKCKEMISSSYCATAALKTLRLHEEWLIQAVVPTLILLTAFFRVSAARSSTQLFCSTTLLPLKKKDFGTEGVAVLGHDCCCSIAILLCFVYEYCAN